MAINWLGYVWQKWIKDAIEQSKSTVPALPALQAPNPQPLPTPVRPVDPRQDGGAKTGSETFRIQECQAYYHPRHNTFYVQSLGGVVFFTHIPGPLANESVRIENMACGCWVTFTCSAGTTIPVALWREGFDLHGRWL